MLALAVLAACLLPASGSFGAIRRDVPASSCDWPMWGRTIERTFATECPGLTPENAADLKRIWFFNTFDVVTATPAVVGNTVYVGDWSGRFYAVRRSNGKKKWTYATKPHARVYAGQIVSSAAVELVDGVRTVYFGGGKTLYALRARDGKLLWKHEIGAPGDGADYSEIESSPIVVDNLVIVGWDVHNDPSGRPAGVLALDAATGEEAWTSVLAPTEGDSATGSGCADVWGSPTVDIDLRFVYVGTGNCVTTEGWGRFAEAIVALRLDDGSVAWSYQPHEQNKDDFDFAGAPNLFETADGRALVGLGNKDGNYYTVDRATGEEVWQTHAADAGLPEPGSNFSTGGFIGGTAYTEGIISGGTAVGGSPFLHALDATSGEIIWQQPEAAATYGAAAVANGVLVIGGTDFTIRALDVATGEVLWREEVSGAVSGGAAIVDDDVIAVAGIREPGVGNRSRTSGVYKFSLHGKPVTSTTGETKPAPTATTIAGAIPDCVKAPCNVAFDLKQPPAGTNPTMTLELTLDPWRAEIRTTGFGPPETWLRAGSPAAADGATRFGVFISESDDNPQGGLLCILEADGSCVSSKIPRPGAAYNRISVLAITDSDELPSTAQGFDRLVTTKSFNPLLVPVAGKSKGKKNK
ncbi:MAG: PQQ-binding-like beta-propeller repeat protein [Acidimicrobiia bacterium]